ncbi:hypothetical protein [Dinghuibacter silviterrae]|uniref:Uncharacterized protein n=1 Tax=Dinghuibacter silviterrae TaxID=1539049 RepID=A0A4V3GKK4_9BACT|nr:hypothetical protein [Dinghuibacter silviterrae]TDW95972.1 hypothetical protein EDB95_3793 [Dinghuibacter silviterrae]
MYLKRLFTYHKGWFAFVALFALAGVIVCIKRGVVLTPFFQYGMYSKVENPQGSYTIPVILVNGRPLQTADYSGRAWDKIVAPLEAFRSGQEGNRQLWTTDISRLLHLRDSTPYVNRSISDGQFLAWYKAYVSRTIHRSVDTLSIQYATYSWENR